MKKLYALLLCFAITLHADQLSDAIRASDLETVQALLTEMKPNAKQMIKYLDTAEHAIELRQEFISTYQRHSSYPESYSIKQKFYTLLTWASAIAFFNIMGALTRDDMARQYSDMLAVEKNDTMIAFIKNARLEPSTRKACNMYLGLSVISFIGSIVARSLNYDYTLKEHYAHAIMIKELLYDYALSLETA